MIDDLLIHSSHDNKISLHAFHKEILPKFDQRSRCSTQHMRRWLHICDTLHNPLALTACLYSLQSLIPSDLLYCICLMARGLSPGMHVPDFPYRTGKTPSLARVYSHIYP
jgi:hypothetical protein